MAQLVPFRGIHFDPARVPLTKVIAPPYDVLSAAQQNSLYACHEENIVRLILNREDAGDPSGNRYVRAAAFLHQALEDGVLVRDEEPALYGYIQRFADPLQPERTVERHSLFVALKLEPYANGVVLPHEETHPKAKADRLELMRATSANPEPIYGLFEDPDRFVASRLQSAAEKLTPLLHAVVPTEVTPRGEEHIVYRFDDPAVITDLQDFFAPRRVWIADGHHRYETALNYQRERRASAGDPATAQPYDFLLIGLSAFEDPGLVVLPTHRLIRNVSRECLEALPAALERYFDLRMMPLDDARDWIKETVPGQTRLAILKPGACYALTLRDIGVMDTEASSEHCEAWRRLDVSILQALVLDRSLGISWSALASTPDVAYTRDEQEAVDRLFSGEFQLACLLQNPSVTEVRDVAAAGDKMPQKSTFFYPKLWSGLILRTLTE